MVMHKKRAEPFGEPTPWHTLPMMPASQARNPIFVWEVRSDTWIFPRPCGRVTVQVVKTGLTPQIAPSDRLREAETVQRHPAEPLRTPL